MALIFFIKGPTKQTAQTENTVYAALVDQNFYHVRDAYLVELYGEDTGMSFDLQKKQLFGSSIAIKDGKLYGDELQDWTLDDYYENEEDYFLDATRHIPVDKDAIKKDKYKQVIKLADIWNHFKSEDVTNDVIENFTEGNLTQLRISYSKDFLPLKLEGYYQSDQDRGWKDLFYIDYPYKDQVAFDQALDSYISTLQSQTSSDSREEEDLDD